MLRLDRYRLARDFQAAAQPWLAEREAEHNLILGLVDGLANEEWTDDEAPLYFAVVRRGSRPVAAAMRTPPFNLLLSEVDDPAALDLLADDLAGQELPGVTGPPEAVNGFAAAWIERSGGGVETLMEERVYRLTTLVPPAAPPGEARRATADDRPLLSDWLFAFHAEALPEEDAERGRRMVADWDPDTGRQFWIWEVDGRPVSLVGAGSRTPNGIRVGPVYTPPSERGHGYASALTAAASGWNLGRGLRYCFLYTNLANPTANHIYQAIGYEPVTDARMVRFV